MAVSNGKPILAGDMASLATLANSKTGTGRLGGTSYAFPDYILGVGSVPTWKTELERLRTHLNTYLAAMQVDASKQSVSGPWPISGPAWSNHDQWFWFEDPGVTVTVTVSSAFDHALASWGKFSTTELFVDCTDKATGTGIPNRYNHEVLPKLGGAPNVRYQIDPFLGYFAPQGPSGTPTNYSCLIATQKTYSIIVGGSQAVSMVGKFWVKFLIDRGNTYNYFHSSSGTTETTVQDPTDPNSLITVSGNFPGTVSSKVVAIAGQQFVFMEIAVNQTVTPGRYDLVLAFDTRGGDSYFLEEHEDSKLDTDPDSPTYNTLVPDPSTYWLRLIDIKHTRLQGAMGVDADSSTGYLFSSAVITYGGPDVNGVYIITAQTGSLTISVGYTASVPADGIDGVHDLKKINLPDEALTTMQPGIYSVVAQLIDPPGTPSTTGTGDQFGLDQGAGYARPFAYANVFPPSAAFEYNPFPQPKFSGEKISPGSWGVTTSVPGFWTGITSAVADLRAAACALMPWNFARQKVVRGSYLNGTYAENPMLSGNGNPDDIAPSNSYNHNLTCEAQSEPARWKAATWFTAGFMIVDAAGRGFFRCTSTGYSGSTEPAWTFTVGEVTSDIIGVPGSFPSGGTHASAGWTCIRVFKPANTLEPALHRARPIPRYPVYWQPETILRLKPPGTNLESEKTVWGCGNQWQDSSYRDISNVLRTEKGFQSGNLAKGWFIYAVSLNRITNPLRNISGPGVVGAGATDTGAGDTDSGAGGGSPAGSDNMQTVAVTIGCIRSGSFVAFGTYATGQTIKVLWPVFTSDALVYQCSERVDVQAVAISSAGAGVATGLGTIAHPIAAAFVADTQKLLGFVQ